MKQKNRFTGFAAIALIMLGVVYMFFTSCDKDDTEPKPTMVKVTDVTLNKTTLALTIGKSEKLTAIIAPTDATNKKMTWRSDNVDIAAISTDGTVTAVKAGTTTITVTTEDGSKTATCAVTVTSATVSVTGVSLNKNTLSLVEGGSEALTVTVAPGNATNKSVTWSTNNASVATVDSNGNIIAVKAGNAVITVTTTDGSKTATCAVTVTSATVSVTGVSLNKNTLSLVEGSSETLTATVAPTNATNKNVTWKSSNTATATVDADGKVTAVKAGTATITVTTEDGSKTATCTITVTSTKVSVTGVTFNKTALSLTEGGSEALTITVAPENATNKNVTWKSNNVSVATVDSNGNVIAVKEGHAIITVTTEDGSKTATCAVTVTSATVSVTGVSLNKSTLSLVEGSSETLSATIAPTNATNKNVTWKSNNTATATVDANGKITAVKAGTATITVTTADGSKTATCAVTVTAKTVAVAGVTLSKTTLSLVEGGNETLVATIAPTNATNKNVTWKSSNTAIATVNASGNVTAVKAGTATITVTTTDGSKTATCAVTVTAKAPVPMFIIGAQAGDGGDGILDSGTMEWVKYSLTGMNGMTFTGKTAAISWFSDAAGNNATTEPVGVHFSILKFPGENDNIVSLGASIVKATPEGSYYFRIIIEGVTSSNVGVLKVGKAWEMKINNVTWAARNVERPALFVSNPEDTGWYYQRNRYTGWSPTDPLTPSHDGEKWNSVADPESSWSTRNNPCPAGFRLPTLDDINTLLDKTSVDREWVTQNGVKGYKFTDKKSGNTLFIPAGGYRDSDGKLSSPEGGRYLTSTYEEDTVRRIWRTRTLYFDRNEIRPGFITQAFAYTVRCVKK